MLRLRFLLPVLLLASAAMAGGPLATFGPSVNDGHPVLWDARQPVRYYTDGGMLGNWSNEEAVARVASMFQVWESVPTASIRFERAGVIPQAGGDVSTPEHLNAVTGACRFEAQTSIVFDANGGLFAALGMDSSVIGFASLCSIHTGFIRGAMAVMNGSFLAGGPRTLQEDEFDAAFIHEFGHLIGLDHSQINPECIGGECHADAMDGLPTMFPLLVGAAQKTLAPDDIAWVSRLYPAAGYAAAYGLVTGRIYFSDGVTALQGANVIARRVDDAGTPQDEALRFAISATSGYRFSGNFGQNVTGNNNEPNFHFGSRNLGLIGYYELPLPPGQYTIEIESIRSRFIGGSGVGQLSPPVPLPGPVEYWNLGESANDDVSARDVLAVSAGQVREGIDVIVNGTSSANDEFEGRRAAPPVQVQP